MKISKTTSIAAFSIAALLTACGGGSGSGDDKGGGASYTGPTKAYSVTGEADAQALVSGTVFALFGAGKPVGATGTAAALAAEAPPPSVARVSADGMVAPAETVSGKCGLSGSGSITRSGTYGRAGYRYSETWNHCAGYPLANVRLNGSRSGVLKAVKGTIDDSFNDWSATWAHSFTAFKAEEWDDALNRPVGNWNLLDGDITQAVTFVAATPSLTLVTTSKNYLMQGNTGRVAYQRLIKNYRADVTTNTTTNAVLFSLDGSAYATDIGGHVTLDTTVPFDFPTGMSGAPTAGQLVITGAKGAKVQLTVDGRSDVSILYDVDGVAGWDNAGSPIVVAWGSL